MKVQVTSSKRTRGPKRIEMLFTESITFQLYRSFCGVLTERKGRLEKDNAESEYTAAADRAQLRGTTAIWRAARKRRQDRRTPNVLRFTGARVFELGIRFPSAR